MKLPALILVAVSAILAVAPASAQERVNPPAKEQPEASAQKIKELQKERIATLKEQLDLLNELARSPRAQRESNGEALETTLLLLQAELEITEKGADRIALYQKAIDRLKQFEKMAKADVAAGRNSELPLLRIKARRLDVEIQLEKAKVKEAKEGK